jgi:hypothetical protein
MARRNNEAERLIRFICFDDDTLRAYEAALH